MKYFTVLFLAVIFLTGCVAGSKDIRVLDDRIYAQGQQIESLGKRLQNMETISPDKANVWSDMQSIQRDLSILKEQQQALKRDITELKKLETMSEDIEDIKTGWNKLNSRLGTDVSLDKIRAERMAAAAALSQSVAPSQPSATKTMPPPVTPKEQTPAKVTATITPKPDNDASSMLYASARTAFEESRYRQGIALWDEFVTTFPRHSLVPNALFWQGECYFQMKDYPRAALKYQEVLDKYPKSSKYPTAMLKQGIAFIRVGQTKAGKVLLRDVEKKFPGTPEGKRATAILKNMDK